MPQQDQTAKPQPHKTPPLQQISSKTQPNHTGSTGMPLSSMDTQDMAVTGMLTQLPEAQQQAMIGQMGQMHGNAYVRDFLSNCDQSTISAPPSPISLNLTPNFFARQEQKDDVLSAQEPEAELGEYPQLMSPAMAKPGAATAPGGDENSDKKAQTPSKTEAKQKPAVETRDGSAEETLVPEGEKAVEQPLDSSALCSTSVGAKSAGDAGEEQGPEKETDSEAEDGAAGKKDESAGAASGEEDADDAEKVTREAGGEPAECGFESPRLSSISEVRSTLSKLASGGGGIFGNATPSAGNVLPQVPSVAAWRNNMEKSVQGINKPNISRIVRAPQRLQSLNSNVLTGHLKAKPAATFQNQARKSVAPPPKAKEPPPAPGANPVPEAIALIAAAANKAVPQQRMPALAASPGGKVPNVGGGVVKNTPPAQKVAPPKAGAAQPGNPKHKAMQEKKAQASKVTAAAGAAPGFALPDVPPAPQVEALPDDFKAQLAKRLKSMLTAENLQGHAKSVLAYALEQTYPNGVLKKVAPEGFGSDLEKDEAKVIQDAAGALRALVVAAQDSLQERVGGLKAGVKQAHGSAAQGLQAGGTKAKQALSQAGGKKRANIAGAGTAVREEIAKKTAAADTKLDPTAIRKKRSDLIAKIVSDTAAADANYRRVEKERHQQLDRACGRYQSAYRRTAREEATTIKTKYPDDEAKGRAEAQRSLKWGDAQARAVKKAVAGLKRQVSRVIKGYRDALQKAAAAAKKKIAAWAKAELNKLGVWEVETKDQAVAWAEQAKANEKAWEKVQLSMQLQDMARDYRVMQAYKKAAAAGNKKMMQKTLRYLSQEQSAAIKAQNAFPIYGVLNDIINKIKKQRAPALSGKLKEMALAKLNMQQLNDIGAAQNPGFDARKQAREVYTAVASWTGTDEKKLFGALENRTPEQIAAIRKAYSQYHGGRVMEADIKKEWAITGAALDRVDAALSGDKTAQTVAGLRNAMKGSGGFSSIGSDKEAIRNALRDKSPREIAKIKASYVAKYGQTLETDLKGELGNWFTKDYELERANALLAGDTAKADAIGIEQAMEGTWFSTDTQAIEKIYNQNRQDVEKTADKKNMTTAELEAAVRARNAGIEKAYNQRNSGKANLRSAVTSSYDKSWFKTEASAKADKDLVGGLMDNNATAIDAARMQSAASSAAWYRNASMYAGGGAGSVTRHIGGHLFNQDKAITDVLKAQHERAKKAVLRDEKVKFMKRKANAKPGSPEAKQSWADYQKKHKAQLEAQTAAAAKGNMGDLQAMFGKRYGEHWKGEKAWSSSVDALQSSENRGKQSALETAVGFGTSTINNRGEMGKTLIKQNGKLSDAQALAFAMHGTAKKGAEKPNWLLSQIRGWGTDEDAIKKTFTGKSAKEIAEIKKEYNKLTGRGLKKDLEGELDGRDRFDVLEDKFLGEPKTLEEKLARAKKRRNFERRQADPSLLSFVPVIGDLKRMSYELSAVERKRLDITIAESEAKLKLYQEAEKKGDKAKMAQLKKEFNQVYGCVDYDVGAYRKAVDAIADNTATAVGITVATVGSVVATVASAGTAGPAVAAMWAAGLAAAGGAASLTAKVAIKGLEAHGYETLAGDIGLLAIDVALAAATAGLVESSSLAKSLLDGDEFVKFITRGKVSDVAKLPIGQRLLARALGSAATSVSGGLPSMVIGSVADEKTWKGDMPIKVLLNSIATKMVTSAGFASLSGPINAEINGLVKTKLKNNTLVEIDELLNKKSLSDAEFVELSKKIRDPRLDCASPEEFTTLLDAFSSANYQNVDGRWVRQTDPPGKLFGSAAVEGDVEVPNSSAKPDAEVDVPEIDAVLAGKKKTDSLTESDVEVSNGKNEAGKTDADVDSEIKAQVEELLESTYEYYDSGKAAADKAKRDAKADAPEAGLSKADDELLQNAAELVESAAAYQDDVYLSGKSTADGSGMRVPQPDAVDQQVVAKYGADQAVDVFRTIQDPKNAALPKELLGQRAQTAYDFYIASGFNRARTANHVPGIDYSQPVEVTTLKKGMVVEQWQIPSAPQGTYYTPVGTPMSKLGISEKSFNRSTGLIEPRELKRYVVLTEDVEVLRSTTAPIVDTWSIPGETIQTGGGGIQYFTTDKGSFKAASVEED